MGIYGNLWKKMHFHFEVMQNIYYITTTYRIILFNFSICSFNLDLIIIWKKYKNLLKNL